MAQLNTMADQQAKDHLSLAIQHSIPSKPVPQLASELWSCSTPFDKVTFDPWPPLPLILLGGLTAQSYFMSHGIIAQEALNLVNWLALCHAYDSSPPLFHLWVSKFSSGHAPVGKVMFCCREWPVPRPLDAVLFPICSCPGDLLASWCRNPPLHHSVCGRSINPFPQLLLLIIIA